MPLVLPSPAADPWQVLLRKGWHACELVRQEWCENAFWQIWDGSGKDGPVFSFKEPLQEVHVAGSCRGKEPAWRSKYSAVRLLARACRCMTLSGSAIAGRA